MRSQCAPKGALGAWIACKLIRCRGTNQPLDPALAEGEHAARTIRNRGTGDQHPGRFDTNGVEHGAQQRVTRMPGGDHDHQTARRGTTFGGIATALQTSAAGVTANPEEVEQPPPGKHGPRSRDRGHGAAVLRRRIQPASARMGPLSR